MGKVIAMKITRKGTKEILLERDFTNKDGSLLPSLYFPMLERDGIAMNLISTRLGGVSEGQFRSLNLTTGRGDSKENVLENFSRIAAAFGTDPAHCICSHQVHETKVRRVGKEDAGMGLLRPMVWESADGVVTNEPGLVLSTFYADCVPLLFVDPVRHAVGASHSGWRGTVGKIGAETVRTMQEDVAEEFRLAFPGKEERLLEYRGNPGHYQLDLWEACRITLMEAGVKEQNISVTDICTACNPELLFSHRASGGKRGNIGAFVMLKK